MVKAFAGIERALMLFKLLWIYSIKYKLQTRSMLTDMNSMKRRGMTKVTIMEEPVLAPMEANIS